MIANDIVFSVSDREEDPEENFLLLKLNIKGRLAILGSIYGPNDQNPGFFDRLKNSLRRLGNLPVLLGGDWNCTFATDPIETNIDCLNMQRLPNSRHSEILRDLCAEFNLTDPYRLFFPSRKDFSFKPRSVASKNRSRLDFFLVGLNVLNEVSFCDINPGLQNELFDHKATTLKVNTIELRKAGNPSISRSIINDQELDIVVTLAVAECYIVHIQEQAWLPNERGELLNKIGRIRTQFRAAGPAPVHLPLDTLTAELIRDREETLDLIIRESAELDITRFQEMPITCCRAVFMEVLLNAVRNDTISFQLFIKKI